MTNEYVKFYQPYGVPKDVWQPRKERVRLVEISNSEDVYSWEAKGYCVLGISSFQGKWRTRALAVDCAKKNGASIVLVSSKHLETQAVSQTFYMPTQNTTYHQGTVYTLGGSATYSGTSTTPGVVPMTLNYEIERWEQTAVYLAPFRNKPRFGISFSTQPNTPGVQDETVRVRVVFDGSPAAKQGIRAGDVVRTVNGKKITKRSDIFPYTNGSDVIETMEVEHGN